MNRYEQRMKELTDFCHDFLPKRTRLSLSEAEMREVENQLGENLPADYREFLKDYGGVYIYKGFRISHPKPQGIKSAAIDAFCGLQPDSTYNLFTRNNTTQGAFPPEFIIIGSGENGPILLALSGDEKGAVYFWHGGQGTLEDYEENSYRIADTFDDFIHILEP